MNNNLILHKIAIYVNNSAIIKLFFNIKDYRQLINSSNTHFDELFALYGNRSVNQNNLKFVQSIYRLNLTSLLFRNYDIKDSKETPISLSEWAAYHGNLDIIEWLYQYHYDTKYYDYDWSQTCYHAMKRGHLEIVKWFCNINFYHFFYKNNYLIDYAAAFGHYKIVIWLHTNLQFYNVTNTSIISNDSEAIRWAATNGHFNIVKYLYRKKYPFSGYIIDYAAANGHLNIIKWIFLKFINNHLYQQYSHRAMDWSAKNGHLKVLKWLYKNCRENHKFTSDSNDINEQPSRSFRYEFTPFTKEIIDGAAENGHLEVLKWLFKNRLELSICNPHYDASTAIDAIDMAAKNGHFEVVKYLCEKYDNSHNMALEQAAKYGHFEIVKYLFHHHNMNIFTFHQNVNTAFSNAAEHGHLDIVKWLYNNSHITKSTCEYIRWHMSQNFSDIHLDNKNKMEIIKKEMEIKGYLDKIINKYKVIYFLHEVYWHCLDLYNLSKHTFFCFFKFGYKITKSLLNFIKRLNIK